MGKYTELYNSVKALLEQERLSEALVQIRPFASPTQAGKLDTILQEYTFLLKYTVQGLPDPRRQEMYNTLKHRTLEIASEADRDLHIKGTDATLYFSTLRRLRLSEKTLSEYIRDYRKLIARKNIVVLSENAGSNLADIQYRIEETEKQLFLLLWTLYPLHTPQTDELSTAFADPALPQSVKLLLVSALSLGQFSYPDPKRFGLLCGLYLSDESSVLIKARCFVGIILSIWMFGKTTMPDDYIAPMKSVADSTTFQSDLNALFLQLVRTSDTEQINQKITNDILPEILKIRPDLKKTIENSSIENIEANPEWEELLDKSGITDKLQQLSTFQAEGSDVMMATFGKLKTFSFFNDISNWFLPFHTSHTLVSQQASHTYNPLFAQVLENNPMLCDSDKYSTWLAMSEMPQGQSQTLKSQLDSFAEHMTNDALSSKSIGIVAAMQNYVRDLYRFFTIFRRNDEFQNPFKGVVNLLSSPVLEPFLTDSNTIRLAAEYLFKRNFFKDAITLFNRYSFMVPPSYDIFQKIGFAYQELSNYSKAIQYYEQSDLLRSDNNWTLRKLAQCHKAQGNLSTAIEIMERVSKNDPDNIKTAYFLGKIYFETNQYDEARKQFYKILYKNPRSQKTGISLALCEINTSNPQKALELLSKYATESNPMHHLYIAAAKYLTVDYNAVVDELIKSIALFDFDIQQFHSSVSKSVPRNLQSDLIFRLLTDQAVITASSLGTHLQK